jgi:hypothetical protein
MKIKPTLTFLFVLTHANVFAQNGNNAPDSGLMRHRNEVLNILAEQKNTMQFKPTGITQRVIAQTFKSETFNDSVSFVYSGTRGSRFNYNNLSYNSILDAVYEPSYIYYPRSLNALDMLADTLSYYRSSVFSYKDVATYRSDNKCSIIFSEYGAEYANNRSKSIYTYNNDGFCDANYFSDYNDPGPFDTTSLLKHSYNGNILNIDSSLQKENGIWNLSQINRFNSNATGKIISDSVFYDPGTGMHLAAIERFTYNASDKLQSITTTKFSGNSIIETTRDSLAYANDMDYVTYWKIVRKNSSGNTIYEREEVKYPGTIGLPDSTTVTINSSGAQSKLLYHYQYNSFNNPEEIRNFKDGNTSTIPDEVYHFYYETFDDGLAINTLKFDDDRKVSPNPFYNRIEITGKTGNDEKCKVTMMDALGKIVFLGNSSFHNGMMNISLPETASGIYILRIQGTNGKLWVKKLVKK